MRVDPESLVELRDFKLRCGHGIGLAACPILRLLVTSHAGDNTLDVFSLPSLGDIRINRASVLKDPLYKLGGTSSASPAQPRFGPFGEESGFLAFTGSPTSRLLVVSDAGQGAVHIVDVVSQVHIGFVARPGSISRPRGVAASGSLVAVCEIALDWEGDTVSHHRVRLYQGTGPDWAPIRVLAGAFLNPGCAPGQLDEPLGIRFTEGGSQLAVADSDNDRISFFRVGDGSFAGCLPVDGFPLDLVECEGGWLVSCLADDVVRFVVDGPGADGRVVDVCGDLLRPWGLALVPGLGLVARDLSTQTLHFFASADAIAMASMSVIRVAWLLAVSRAVLWRGARALARKAPNLKRHCKGA